VITDGGTLTEAARRAVRALDEFDIAGAAVNVPLLRALLQAPGLGTHDVGWLDAHLAELAGVSPEETAPSASAPANLSVGAGLGAGGGAGSGGDGGTRAADRHGGVGERGGRGSGRGRR
jgi:hypothetical protein